VKKPVDNDAEDCCGQNNGEYQLIGIKPVHLTGIDKIKLLSVVCLAVVRSSCIIGVQRFKVHRSGKI